MPTATCPIAAPAKAPPSRPALRRRSLLGATFGASFGAAIDAPFGALIGGIAGAAALPAHAATAATSTAVTTATTATTATTSASQGGQVLTIDWRGTPFMHRWSQDGQHEFTPASSPDLARWRDMLTLNVHDSIRDGEQLAQMANKVLANYQQHGKILQTRSTPRSADRPAEHLIVAVLGAPQLLEAVFARCLLRDGLGLVVVVSRRIYGQAVGPQMSEWLRNNGLQTEQALMAWAAMPAPAALKQLPRSA